MKIYLDPGHGCPPRDTGAEGIMNEERVVREICSELKMALIAAGHEVRVSKPTDGSSVTASLSQRCSDANNWGADLVMSLHCNANETTNKPMGTEVFATSTKGQEYAQKIHDAIAGLGFKSRGVKDGSKLFVLKNTDCVAVLIEFFFIDSQADCDLYSQLGAKKIALEIASKFGGSPARSINPPTTTAPKTMVRPHFLADASRYDKNLDHQVAAWDWLQSQIPEDVLSEFQKRFTPEGQSIGMASESTPKKFDPSDIDWSNGNCRISKYFTVMEVTKGDSDRIPEVGSDIEKNILTMAAELDKLREAWGQPIGVTSWYRPPAVNRAVGGASQSQHLYGRGVDVYPIDGDVYEFQDWCLEHWYGALGRGAHRSFVHLDNRSGKGFGGSGEKGVRWDY